MDGSAFAPNNDEVAGPKHLLTSDSHLRLKQRRQMLILQAISYALGDTILWVYAYANTIHIAIPIMFLICGMGITGLFGVLSEVSVGDRFGDHFLTTPQATANIIMQLGFLLAAPEIGFLFLTVVFVIFGFAALRMTSREAVIL